MRKVVSIILALTMALSCVSALAETAAFTPADSYDVGERAFNAGEVVLIPAGEGGGTINTVRYAGEEGKDYTDEKVYTLVDTLGGTNGMDWNPHTWETNDDNVVLSMMTIGFYGFYLNENKDGYAILPEMAADYPVDVTSEYVGQFGVAEGETAKAWRIALNPDACWENGEKITADDYIYSMQQQLNPKMLNRRADSYYAGDMVIVNAKNYLYAGKTTYDLITEAPADLLAAGEEVYLDMDFWGCVGALDAEGNAAEKYISINDDTMYRDTSVEDETAAEAWVSAKYLYDNYLAAGAPYEAYASQYLYTASIAEGATWDEVGLKKIDDYTIDLILERPVQEAAFYMPYNLSGTWLVYKPLYEACKTFYDADGKAVDNEEAAATVNTDYCTTVEKSVSYGPYKISYFEMDKQIKFDRNENWYGYHDGKHLGMYQTDIYQINIIKEQATELMAFLAGEIDSVGLTAADMATYASSQYIKYTPESYTTKVSFNTDYQKLLSRGTGSQILVVDEFRKAFALALDRAEFAASYTAAGAAGLGLLNYMYVYNPFTGETYRDSDYAKAGLVELYGLTWGEGGDYATLDEAYDAMTGYDMDAAKELMKVAYDKAVAAQIYDGTSPIEIEFRVYSNDTTYVQMFTYFDTQLQKACEGSGFEGKVSLKMTVDPDYYETNYSGGADVIFTTWGGSAMAPFSVMNQCYTDAYDGSGNQMEYGFNTEEIALTITVNGEEVTASLHDWSDWVGATDVPALDEKLGVMGDYSYETRCGFLAAIEKCFLSYFTTTPMYYRQSASMISQKINYATDRYDNMVGFGGIEFTTYNYDDASWAEYVASGELKY